MFQTQLERAVTKVQSCLLTTPECDCRAVVNGTRENTTAVCNSGPAGDQRLAISEELDLYGGSVSERDRVREA